MFTLTSPAFQEGASIPQQYTCEIQHPAKKRGVSPSLKWEGQPNNTKSFALVMDDPDAPDGTWIHWVVFNIPPTQSFLEEGTLLPHTQLGTNSWGEQSYGGPCPPSGEHRYFFKLYALDKSLTIGSDVGPKPTSTQLQSAIRGHVIGETTLMARYRKKAHHS